MFMMTNIVLLLTVGAGQVSICRAMHNTPMADRARRRHQAMAVTRRHHEDMAVTRTWPSPAASSWSSSSTSAGSLWVSWGYWFPVGVIGILVPRGCHGDTQWFPVGVIGVLVPCGCHGDTGSLCVMGILVPCGCHGDTGSLWLSWGYWFPVVVMGLLAESAP